MGNSHRDHAFTQAIAPLPRTHTELTRRHRVISFSDARIAVEWLNATMGNAPYRRILKIRKELEELGVMIDAERRQSQELRAKFKGRKSLPSRPEWEQQLKQAPRTAAARNQLRDRHNALNQVLARYTFCPVMVYDLPSGVWRYSAVPRKMRGPVVEVFDGAVTVQVDEATVVAALVRLAVNRELHKARLCEQCQERWKVSERRMDRFCSEECRIGFRRSDEESRARHARNQRKYRENVKLHPRTGGRR